MDSVANVTWLDYESCKQLLSLLTDTGWQVRRYCSRYLFIDRRIRLDALFLGMSRVFFSKFFRVFSNLMQHKKMSPCQMLWLIIPHFSMCLKPMTQERKHCQDWTEICEKASQMVLPLSYAWSGSEVWHMNANYSQTGSKGFFMGVNCKKMFSICRVEGKVCNGNSLCLEKRTLPCSEAAILIPS